MALTNATVARNALHATGHSVKVQGGGLYSISGGPANPSLEATIVGLNSAKSGPDCHGTFPSEGYNLVRKTLGCKFVKKATDKVHVDPKLGPLASNGGPTQTDALLIGSPAIDAIPHSACAVTVDQRNVPRPQHRRCDIGAYERKA
jgi:hypothetical protein